MSYFKQHHSTTQIKHAVCLANSRLGSVSFPFPLAFSYLIIFTASEKIIKNLIPHPKVNLLSSHFLL